MHCLGMNAASSTEFAPLTGVFPLQGDQYRAVRCACGMYSDSLAISTLLCCMLSYTGIKLNHDSVVGHLSVCAQRTSVSGAPQPPECVHVVGTAGHRVCLDRFMADVSCTGAWFVNTAPT